MIVETALTVAGIVDAVKLISATIAIVGFIAGVFKVINWIKGKFISINDNVLELKTTMTETMTGLREDVKAQTHVLSAELREQRQDFRTFYAPYIMQQAQLQPPLPVLAKAKRTAPKRKLKS